MTDESAAAAKNDPRIFCFHCPEDDGAFEQSVTKLLDELNELTRVTLVSRQNVLRMIHGKSWIHSAREPGPQITMHSISAEWSIPYLAIADNDLGLIGRSILPLSAKMSQQFAQSMYDVVGAAAKSVGNVVDAKKNGSVSQALIEMMAKIEFGVDRKGNVNMPEVHLGTEAYATLTAELENMTPEVAAELEMLKLEKIQQALDREAARRQKFSREVE